MTTSHTRSRTLLLTLGAAALALVLVLGVRPAPGSAAATSGTTPTPLNTVVLHMGGSIQLKLDKDFLKTVKRAKAKVQVKNGATMKGRTVTLPVDATTTVTLSPMTADILAKGTIVVRRKDGRKVVSQDITLRLRDTGADLGATLRGRPQKELAAFTLSPTTGVQQVDSGYKFVDIQMLVSTDFVSAARKAKLKGFKAGALMGLMNSDVRADLPNFTFPGLDLPGLLG